MRSSSRLRAGRWLTLAALALSGCGAQSAGFLVRSGDAGDDGNGTTLGDDGGGFAASDLAGLDLTGLDLTGMAGAKPVDPNDPDNDKKDSDCDGLSDLEEFQLVYPGGKRTDPANPDSDGDGVMDGVELGRTSSVANCGFVGDTDPKTTTLPTVADTDGDGIADGREDSNGNGRRDPGETDPLSADSDGDGLADGVEDASHDGKVDPGETDPRKRDTDGDQIGDGVEVNLTKTDPLRADTDGDGCSDGAEDGNQDGIVEKGETDPRNPADCGAMNQKDSDGDGLPDAIEDANGNGQYDPQAGETDLQNPDTDGDGLSDGLEDRNHDGKVSVSETDPRRPDSDCDGLIDGPSQGMRLGEDANGNGLVDPGETDPRNPDSDGDALPDGLERGVTVNPDPQRCPSFVPDADPASTTDPLKADTDGGGIFDGAEDANQNGRIDPNELDPQNPNDDRTGPQAKACAAQALRMVTFKDEALADVQLALPSSFAELATIKFGGVSRGIMGYDKTNDVAFLAYRAAAPNGAQDPVADELQVRPQLGGVGAIANALTQTFTSWDGYPSVQAFYDQSGAGDAKQRANDLANALVGNGAGALPGAGGAPGPFKLQAEYVHRSQNSVIVLIALTPTAAFVEPGIFALTDAASGSALAQFGDQNGVQCERFAPQNAAVDFLFVVDDSGSMAAYQQSLANAGAEMAASLNNSALDWRIALVTTSYTTGGYGNSGVLRGFTRKISDFTNWLSQGQPGWVGTSGSGTELCLNAGAVAVANLTPGTQNEMANKARAGANIVVVILGDADDQSGYGAAAYSNFFANPGGQIGNYTNHASSKIAVSGIICPNGQTCNETQQNPQRHAQVIAATGGVRGDINTPNSIKATIDQVVQSAIAAAGHKMLKPPIGASVKVAMDGVQNPAQCNPDDLPRSRVNGFDFDGLSRSISFFGACRPTVNTTAAAVSYRYWIDDSPGPDGQKPPCFNDPFFDPMEADWCKGKLACNFKSDQCECPADCGAPAPAGMFCDANKYVCDYLCQPDCGGACTGFSTCDPGQCACTCAQNASCAPGFVFQNGNGQCGCACDVGALNCGPGYMADPAGCRCVCQPDCGGCPMGKSCNPSTCECKNGIG